LASYLWQRNTLEYQHSLNKFFKTKYKPDLQIKIDAESVSSFISLAILSALKFQGEICCEHRDVVSPNDTEGTSSESLHLGGSGLHATNCG
jgi:hypothetical protein